MKTLGAGQMLKFSWLVLAKWTGDFSHLILRSLTFIINLCPDVEPI